MITRPIAPSRAARAVRIARGVSITLLAASLVPGCVRKESDDANAPAPAAAPASDTPAGQVAIPATVRDNLGLTFATAERRYVANTMRVPGAFELEPLARHEYRIPLSGHVELAVDQYEKVEPGSLLYRYRSPEWPELQHEIIVGEQAIDTARAEIDVAQATLDEARANLDAIQSRLDAIAAADFKRADIEATAAELAAGIPRLEAQLSLQKTKLANAQRTREHAVHRAAAASGLRERNLVAMVMHDGQSIPAYRTIDWIEVRATETAIVESIGASDGAFLEPPSVVVATVDPTRVRFRARALQSDLPRLRDGLPARIVPPRAAGVDISDGVDARLSIGLEAHADDRTVMLIARPEDLRPWTRAGVSAFLEIVVESSGGPAVAIPRSAVLRDGITHVFFRRAPSDPNLAVRIEADLGVDDGRWVEVRSGLAAGDEVVLDGAYELKLATATAGTVQKGGHFHSDGSFHGEEH